MNDESIVILKAKELREIIREELRANRPQEPDMTPGERLTRRQAAKFLDVSYQSVYNYVKRGLIKPRGICKKQFYLKSELMEVIKNSK